MYNGQRPVALVWLNWRLQRGRDPHTVRGDDLHHLTQCFTHAPMPVEYGHCEHWQSLARSSSCIVADARSFVPACLVLGVHRRKPHDTRALARGDFHGERVETAHHGCWA